MDCSYYPNHFLDPMDNILSDESKEDYYNNNSLPAEDGLVFNHLQQTLQVQTNMKYQQRAQDFLNCNTITGDNSIMGFDELYSSESDITYLQLMQQVTPFYTPIESVLDSAATSALSDNCTFDFASLRPSVAGLDIGCSSSSLLLESQHQQLLCHPLSSFPDITTDFKNDDHSPCDYYFDNNDMFASLSCNTTFDTNNCFNELIPSSYIQPILSYPSPKFHGSATSLSTISSDHQMAYRNNSVPLLSASYSFSSFSSASTNEDDSAAEEELLPPPTKKLVPKKSASISFLPEKKRQQQKKSTIPRNNSITKNRKFSLKKNGISSDSLSYYLSKQRLSDDNEDYDEEDFEGDGLRMTGSASSGMLCKKGRNVDKACNHCKRSHLRCDNVRPCRRCVATGKVGCQDVKHKPRGRPRLQKRL